jgi:hypothetical protein
LSYVFTGFRDEGVTLDDDCGILDEHSIRKMLVGLENADLYTERPVTGGRFNETPSAVIFSLILISEFLFAQKFINYVL